MLTDKEIKEKFRVEASKSPEKYYAIDVLKKEGFSRKRCKCGIYFWSVNSEHCGKAECGNGYTFIGKSPAKNKLDYIEIWKEFMRLFKKFGYTPIKRYPVTARWREDTDFVQASIYDFQPHVVSGEVEAPANPLIVPQFCLRFNDIDNVGITGAHYTGFVMIGQHAFDKPQEFNQERYFSDIHNWCRKGLGLRNEDVIYHEDVWAGGGNFGPCMEFFSSGLELGNQVYMFYEKTETGFKDLKIKVLDMGMGHERNAWFTQGTATSYYVTFPGVMKKLFIETGVKSDSSLFKKFLPYSGLLNLDEAFDIDKVWRDVAKKIEIDTKELKEKILEIAALYSIAEHSRALLVALNDGALPSNTSGGYNLRAIFRRAMSLNEKYNWNLDFIGIYEDHAKYLKPIFPELMENLDDVNEIIDVEKNKYKATKQKSSQILKQLFKASIDESSLIRIYDSHGISPEIIQEEALKLGKKIKIPDNFYKRVSELHEKKEQVYATKKEIELDLKETPETKTLYFDNYKVFNFKAKVVWQDGKYLALNKTYFYPTSGGQLHDTGTIANEQVVDVFKQGNVIVHVLKGEHKFPIGEEVNCEIDKERRIQLAKHHTATHIINAAARKILGNHVNQASAFKDIEKARIDITHYESLTDDLLKKIENEANKIIKNKIKIKKSFMPRTEAEKKYGMTIYQGGVPIGKELRIVEIDKTDIECCGGTHLDNTSEVDLIKIIKSSKISDSIVRIEFVAGDAAKAEIEKESKILEEAASLLNVDKKLVYGRAIELFELWKDIIKKGKKRDIIFKSNERLNLSDKEILEKTASALKTQPEHVPKAIARFLKELGITQ